MTASVAAAAAASDHDIGEKGSVVDSTLEDLLVGKDLEVHSLGDIAFLWLIEVFEYGWKLLTDAGKIVVADPIHLCQR